ncbi:SGNH/GDSL hydrolase family protein [Nocardia sp. NBC_01009]|uniref:SGNH/GDSL hydrolase family protein n=1 Tax=Nocardia sp. NBC_01009 TaxID=2975996 RepID=UPI00386DA1EF
METEGVGEQVTLGFWGTSLTEHPAGVSSRLVDQANLPRGGESVMVEGVECRGYVHRVSIALQIRFPHKVFRIMNHGSGGATSRDVLACAQRTGDRVYGVAACEVATNDVLRQFQRRVDEAVAIEEFTANYREMLRCLKRRAARLVCIGVPPIGWSSDAEADLDVVAANRELVRYNESAAECAANAGAVFIDMWQEFIRAAGLLSGWSLELPARPSARSLWHADGLHPSPDLGVELIASLVVEELARGGA